MKSRGCLFTLHAALDPTAGAEPGRLRLAIHVPAGEMLEQVPGQSTFGDRPKPGRVGRQYPANSGIIGKAYRENEVFVSRRVNDDYGLFIKELVKEWNYTEDRARHLNPAVKAWMGGAVFRRGAEHRRGGPLPRFDRCRVLRRCPSARNWFWRP